jgi:hypothetical protein
VTFYATDDAFAPVAEMIRKSGKTYDVFHVAQTFLADPERFVFSLRRNPECQRQFHRTAFDGVPFFSADGALDHLIRNHLDRVFEKIEEECAAPSGNFQQVARCPFTKIIIGAPNHHSYKDLLNEHYLSHVRNMPFDRYCERLEFSKDAADIATWLERMKKRYRYRLKNLDAIETANEPEIADCEDQASKIAEQSETISAQCENAESSQHEEPKIFNSIGDVRIYLAENADRFLKKADSVRVSGKDISAISDRDIREFVEYCLERQRRFPLDTANAMRGKFKRHNLHSYKLGKRGQSYVSPVPRKIRDSSTAFTPELEKLITIIEENPYIGQLELCIKLGSEGADRDELLKSLSWLLGEGYVAEFEDGTLLVHGKKPEAGRPGGGGGRKGEEKSNGAELDHLSHGEEHSCSDDGNGAGEDENCCRLQDCGDAVDGIAKLFFEDVCGVSSHDSESSASLSNGDKSADRCGDCGCLCEELAEGNALSGADGDDFEIVAQCCVGDCTAGESEGLGEGDSVAEDGPECAEK